MKRELNKRLSNAERVKTAQSILTYFTNRQGYSTPKGTVLMGTDNIGRVMTKNKLKKLLKEDFQPKQVITSDLLKYIDDLPEKEPDYNVLKVANGFYDFNKQEFKTKADKPTIVFKESPYNYNEDLIGAPVPEDLQLLFDNLHNSTPEALLEVIGYLLTDGNPLKIVPIFIGDNDTGKTIIMELIANLLDKNTSSADIFNLQIIDISLVEKDLNLISECSEKQLKQDWPC